MIFYLNERSQNIDIQIYHGNIDPHCSGVLGDRDVHDALLLMHTLLQKHLARSTGLAQP